MVRYSREVSAAVRIQRELMDFQQNSPPSLSVNVRADNMNVWVVTLNGVEGTLFEGEKHKLRIEFPSVGSRGGRARRPLSNARRALDA